MKNLNGVIQRTLPYQMSKTVHINEELVFRDEERVWSVQKTKACPHCNSTAHWPVLRRWFEGTEAKYQVACTNPDCEQGTPPFKSSQEAIQFWQVTAAMIQTPL